MDKKTFDQIIAELRASKKHNTSDYNERYPERSIAQKEAIKRLFADEDYKNRRLSALKEKQQTSEWKEAVAKSNKLKAQDPIICQKIKDNHPSKHNAEWHAKMKEILSTPNPKRNAAMKEAWKERDSEWRKQMVNTLTKSTRKPIQTPEGQFESRTAAGNYYKSLGLANAHKMIDKWIKEKPDDYYYIKKD